MVETIEVAFVRSSKDWEKAKDGRRIQHLPYMDPYMDALVERVKSEDSVKDVERIGSFFRSKAEDFKDVDLVIVLQGHLDLEHAIDRIWTCRKWLVKELAMDPLGELNSLEKGDNNRVKMRGIFNLMDPYFRWNGITFRRQGTSNVLEVWLDYSQRSEIEVCAVLGSLESERYALVLPKEW